MTKISIFYYINQSILLWTAKTNNFKGTCRVTKKGQILKIWLFSVLKMYRSTKKIKNQNRFCHPLIMLLEHCAVVTFKRPFWILMNSTLHNSCLRDFLNYFFAKFYWITILKLYISLTFWRRLQVLSYSLSWHPGLKT